jgi:hypothetical protein
LRLSEDGSPIRHLCGDIGERRRGLRALFLLQNVHHTRSTGTKKTGPAVILLLFCENCAKIKILPRNKNPVKDFCKNPVKD